MSQPSQNGAFEGAPPWRPGPVRRQLRETGPGEEAPDRAEVEECRAVLGQEPASGGGAVAAWAADGWDPVLCCWTDPDSLNRMAAVIEMYQVRTLRELALVRDRELEAS